MSIRNGWRYLELSGRVGDAYDQSLAYLLLRREKTMPVRSGIAAGGPMSAKQRTEGEGMQSTHTHDAVTHSHDHYHVTHHHVEGDTFEHRAYWHTHEHNHANLTHSHDYTGEAADHGKEAHIHDHGHPTQ
jgi:hypothetical protein